MKSAVHKAECSACGKVTDHVEITRREFLNGNWGMQEIMVTPLLMCLLCWSKREQ